MAFKIASSPHVRKELQTSAVMQRVILAAMPGLAVQCYFFGWGSFIQVLLAIATAVIAESLVLKLRNRPLVPTLKDQSAVLTAILLGVAIPPLAPWYLVVIGTLFAIVIVKHLYGGLGQNLFNPAMAAYVMLLVSFPALMTVWAAPSGLAASSAGLMDALKVIFIGSGAIDFAMGIDGVTMATPLDTLKTDLSMGLTASESMHKPIFGGSSTGEGWFWVNMAYLAGGLFLLATKTIRWHISVGLLAALFICSLFGFGVSPDNHASPILQLFSGATMLAAFFIATDPVTAATSTRGRLLFGALIGVLVYVIRTYGGYPDGVAFAVLLANLCAPLIDYYIKPRAYGHRGSL